MIEHFKLEAKKCEQEDLKEMKLAEEEEECLNLSSSESESDNSNKSDVE